MTVAIFEKLLRAGEGRMLRRLKAIADAVNSIEEHYTDLTDDELRELTEVFKQRYADGETLDDLLPEAFATVREAAKRVLGQRHYDVQIMGGAALHFGNIAEMKTGEGKTLTCMLPAYLNALTGKGVHVITTNDYLAQRDAEWMGQVHRFLGLTVGVILPNRSATAHREAYECDITYGTNNEFGFDYLRDNMAWSADELVQRGHFFAIVDEVDSILIDEARTPLIISGPAEQSARWYEEFARIVARLEPGKDGEGDYEVDESKRTVAITERGVSPGRGPARHRQPVRVGEHAAGRLPEQRAQGQGALQARQGLHRQRAARSSSSTSSPAASCTAAATTRACTRRSRPRKASRSSRRTRPSPRSPCRTTSACTRSSPA